MSAPSSEGELTPLRIDSEVMGGPALERGPQGAGVRRGGGGSGDGGPEVGTTA